MKKSIMMVMVLLLASSIGIYAKGGKSSSFGKWNYDKYGHASKRVSFSKVKQPKEVTDMCRQYIHINTKFHVRMKNWFRWLQLGVSGYAEMRATLGTANSSCGSAYNIARMDLYYDRNGHSVVKNKSYIRATMKGVGAAHECYKAVGYAYTSNGLVLPDGYMGNFSINVPTSKLPGNLDDILNASGLGEYTISNVTNRIKTAWFIPIRFTTGGATITSKPYAGAVLNEEKGCQKVGGNFIKIKF